MNLDRHISRNCLKNYLQICTSYVWKKNLRKQYFNKMTPKKKDVETSTILLMITLKPITATLKFFNNILIRKRFNTSRRTIIHRLVSGHQYCIKPSPINCVSSRLLQLITNPLTFINFFSDSWVRYVRAGYIPQRSKVIYMTSMPSEI